MNFRNVYRLLGKQHLLADNSKLLDVNQVPQIAKDLEERNKQVTIEALKKQGESYKEFNRKIIKVLDEEAVVEQPADDDDEEAIARFNERQRKIESGVHFDDKYNIDEIIRKGYGGARNALVRERIQSEVRKRMRKQ